MPDAREINQVSERLEIKWSARFEWKLNDFWVGAFWRRWGRHRFDLWICLIPCIPLHISRLEKWSDQ